MTEFGCLDVRGLGPEVALGTLDGAERAEALRHVVGCRACRAYVGSLGEVADALLLAAPQEDPPVGFESRVRAATAATRRVSRGRRRRWGSVAAALLLVVAATAYVAHGAGRRAGTAAVRTGPMVDQERRRVGSATVWSGAAPFVSVRVDGWGHSGTYDLELVLADRRHVRIGEVRLVAGRGSAGAPLPLRVADVRAVWVTDRAHEEWCAFRL